MHHITTPLVAVALYAVLPFATAAAQDQDALIHEALSAAPPALAENAAVMDWEMNTLREGTNGYTCLPTPPMLEGTAPMCLDGEWMKWAHAWMNKQDVTIETVGIGYMLMGDEGASNSDPYAEDASAVDDWVAVGPHLMVIVPNVADLNASSTDYTTGAPWVMWQETPYAHVMVPIGHRGEQDGEHEN